MGRGYEKNLLQAGDVPRTVNDLLHQGLGHAFATRLRPDVDTPDVSFVPFFVVMAAVEARRGYELAILEHAENEIGCGVARAEALAHRLHGSVLVLFGGVGEGS